MHQSWKSPELSRDENGERIVRQEEHLEHAVLESFKDVLPNFIFIHSLSLIVAAGIFLSALGG